MSPADTTSAAPRPPAPGGNALGFSLSLVGGKGVLVLRERRCGELLVCDQLELEIPDLTFPFDMSGGAGKFQHRRCRLRRCRLRVGAGDVAVFVAGRPGLAAQGLAVSQVRLRDGWLEVSGRARRGDVTAPFTARAFAVPAGERGLRLALADARVYGQLPWPAALVGRALLAACAGGPDGADADDGGPRLQGLGDLVLDPLDEVLFRLLPPAGWRLPDVAPARLRSVEVTPTGIVLDYGPEAAAEPELPAAPPARFAARDQDALRFAAVDDELASGSLERGRLACVAALQRDGEQPGLIDRLLQVLAATPGTLEAAAELAGRALAARPGSTDVLLTLAALDLARGAGAEAAARLALVSDRAHAAGDELEAVAAARVAADLLGAADPVRAAGLHERVLQAVPDDDAAATALGACLARARRYGDLAQHLARRATAAATAGRVEAQRRILAELGTVLLERLGDPTGAAAALARAADLGADDPALWESLAHAREAAGDEGGFLQALARAAELWAAAGDAQREAAARSRSAARREQRGQLEPAAADYRRVLALRPDDVATWRRLAAVEERRGRLDEAAAALGRVLELAEEVPARLEVSRELARLALAAGRAADAQAHLDAASALDPRDPATRRLAVDLAAASGDAARLDAALAQAAETASGAERAEVLTRRGLLLWHELGRPGDAAVVLEHAAAAAPAAAAPALRALAALHEARGDDEGSRDALGRLLLVAADADDAPDLACRAAELALRAGDLDAASALAARAAERAPDPRRALRVLEEIQRTARDTTGRIATLERRLAAEERDADPGTVATTLRELGAALLEASRGAEAVARLQAAAALAPDDAPTLRALADACHAAGQTAAAAAAYDRWLALPATAAAADRGAVAARLGELREREGQDRAALDSYREALRAGAQGEEAARAWRGLAGINRRRGDHDAAAQALADAAADPRTQEGPRERAALLVAAADLLRRQLGDAARARACLERAGDLGIEMMPILDALEALEAAEGAHDRVAAVLERKIAASARHSERCKALWARLGELRAGPLGDAAGAREAFTRALELDPTFRPALLRLARDAVARGAAAEAEPHYRALAELPLPADAEPARRDEVTEALAWLAARCLETDRRAEAERLCARALDLQPRAAAPLEVLDELLAGEERHAELVDVLRRRIDLALQSAEPGAVDRALELELRRAALLEQRLHRVADAVAAYRHVLRLQPNHRVGLVRLAALFRRERSWRDLHGVLTRLADLAEQSPDTAGVDAVGLRLELAEVARDGLADPVQAEVHFRRALALDPRSRVALDGLVALHRTKGDVAALDDLLVRRLAVEEDPAAAAALQLERARLLAGARRDAEALALLRALPRDGAPDDALRLRADLCEASGAHREAAEVLEALRARSQGRGDAATELQVARRLGALAAGRGHDRAAEELWRRVLELEPDDDEASAALAEIYRRRRDGQRYLAMLDLRLERARARGAGATGEVDLQCEAARVLLESGDSAGARDRLAAAAALAPEDRRVLRLASEAAAAAGDFAAVAAALERLARVAAPDADPATRADLLTELASVAAERLGDRPRAVAALREATTLYPPGARRQSALRRLAAHAYGVGSFEVAADAYVQLESKDPEDQARLAEAWERCGRRDDAAALWRELEQVAPLRARARARLVSLYREAGAEHELAAALERAAEDETGAPDPQGRATALVEAAQVYQAAGDATAAARCAARALTLGDGEVDLEPLAGALGGDAGRVRDEVERVAAAAETPRRAVLLQALADWLERAGDGAAVAAVLAAAVAAAVDPARRAALHLRRARLARVELHDPALAASAAEAALECTPDDPAALGAAAEAAEIQGDVARAEELLGRRAAHLSGRELRLTIDRMAQLALRRGDAAAFARHLDRVLELDPSDERALAALASLKRTSGDAAGAAALYARLAEVARGDRRRAELLVARGALLADELHDTAGALECFRQAATLGPTAGGLARIASLAMDLGRHDEAAAALERSLELLPADATQARGETLARLGAVRRHQGQEAAARQAFKQAAALLEHDTLWLEMLRRQVELALAAGDPLDALTALRALREAGGASQADLARLTELEAVAAVAHPAAPAALAPEAAAEAAPVPGAAAPVPGAAAPVPGAAAPEAGAAAPEAGAAAPEAPEAAEAAGIPEEGTPEPMGPLETQPLHLTAHDTKPVATVAYLRRLVEQAAERGDDDALDAATVDLWDRLPGDPLAFEHRRRLLAARGDHAALVALVRVRIRHAREIDERLQLWCEAGRLLDEKLGDAERAKQAYEAALAESSDYPAALEALADLCLRGHELPRARELFARLGDRCVRLSPDALAQRRGELAETLGDRAEARFFFLQAAEANPASLEAREALARLALHEGDRTAAISWLKQVERLLPLTRVARRTEIRRQLAELHARAAEPGIARVYLELVLAEDQDSATALELAAGVYAQLGQWELAARALERLSFVVDAPERRADLLYRRGEIYRRRLGDPERAADCYLKAIDLAPGHVPTLRRVIDHYWALGDWAAVIELGADLTRLGPPLADAATFALRLALAKVLATRDVAAAAAPLGRIPLDVEQLRGLLVHVAHCQAAAYAPLETLDGPLALVGAAGGDRLLEALAEELTHHLTSAPLEADCRRLLGRLLERLGRPLAARGHYALCAFVDPEDAAQARLEALGPLAPPVAGALSGMGGAVDPDARGPLRRLLTLLAPALAGLRPGPLQLVGPPLDEAAGAGPAARIERLRLLLGVGALSVHWMGESGAGVSVEPSRPPRLLVSRAAAALPPAELDFLVARGLDFMRSGGLLLARLDDAELAAILSALVADFVPYDHPLTGLGRAFAGELEAVGITSARVPAPLRSQIAGDLEAHFAAPADLAAFRRGQERSADRTGLLACGDLLAALRAHARLEPGFEDTPAGRGARITRSEALRALLDFATGPEIEDCYPQG